MKRTLFTHLIPVVTFIGFLAIGSPAKEPGTTWKWPTSTPKEQNLDASRLNELVRLIDEGKQFPRLDGLLMVRNGYLVLEHYFRGYDKHHAHTLQSVSKSFTSALVGIALEQGKFKGLDEKLLDFFPGLNDINNMDKRKRQGNGP